MRLLHALTPLAILAACGEPAGAPATEPATPEAAAPAPPALTGQFIAVSNTAMSLTGDIDVLPNVISFGQRGFRLEGGHIDTALEPNTDISAGGAAIADATGNTSIQTIELRRIGRQLLAADARDPQLCGPNSAPTYAVLANGAQTLSLLVFSGAEAPGPSAHDTHLCATFSYAPN